MIIAFEQGMQQMLKKSVECDYQEDVLILKKVARIVRNDKSNGFNFNASFPQAYESQVIGDNVTQRS